MTCRSGPRSRPAGAPTPHRISAGPLGPLLGEAAELMSEARAGMTQPLIPGVGQEARGQVVAGIPIHSLRLVGVSAKQDIHFGGDSEVLTVSHDVSSIRAYIKGILMSIRFTSKASGLTVGLQAVSESN